MHMSQEQTLCWSIHSSTCGAHRPNESSAKEELRMIDLELACRESDLSTLHKLALRDLYIACELQRRRAAQGNGAKWLAREGLDVQALRA